MNTDLDNPRLMYERLVFNRKLLVFVHLLVGFFSTVFYLGRVNLTGFAYWRSRAGLGIIFIATPAVAPYVVSAVYSWRVATHRRLGVWLFLLVLVVVSFLMGLLISGTLGIDVRGIEWLFAAATQAGVYIWAAELLLHVV